MPSGTIAVALAARDEAHLESLRLLLGEHRVPHHAVVEGEGRHAGQLMAIGLEPTHDRKEVGRYLSDLPCVR